MISSKSLGLVAAAGFWGWFGRGPRAAAAALMALDDNIWQRLRTPQRAHVVSFPFRRDNYDKVDTVFGYRVQHMTTMGPTKGGVRYDRDVNLGEVTALHRGEETDDPLLFYCGSYRRLEEKSD